MTVELSKALGVEPWHQVLLNWADGHWLLLKPAIFHPVNCEPDKHGLKNIPWCNLQVLTSVKF